MFYRLSWLGILFAAQGGAAEPLHPLAPIAAEEIETAVKVVREAKRFTADAFFPLIALAEPKKSVVASWKPGAANERQVDLTVFERAKNEKYAARVDLATKKLIAWNDVPGVQPLVMLPEYEEAASIAKRDPRFQKALLRRGIDDPKDVFLDGWAPGTPIVPGRKGHRLMRLLAFHEAKGNNQYCRPIEGLVALVDMTKGDVAEVFDGPATETASGEGGDFHAAEFAPQEAAPQAPSPRLHLDGNAIAWQNWRLRATLNPREGLVLHDIAWVDGDKKRTILARAALSEMIVPYGDPDPAWSWRCAFDAGEYGMGQTAHRLVRGADVPASAVLLDAVLANERGKPLIRPATIAVFERSGDVLWKHFDSYSGLTSVRRGHTLVVTSIATIGNYDYGLSWIFHEDGVIEARIDLTGILLAKAVPPQVCEKCLQALGKEAPENVRGDQQYGTLVARDIVAPNHQHFFNFRLDFDIEGTANQVYEGSIESAPAGAANPVGNAFLHKQELLARESAARRDCDHGLHRMWRVLNPAVRNELGHFSGYTLLPGFNNQVQLGKDSIIRTRAGFIEHAFWATKYKPDEMFAAGDYPRQRPTSDGLPKWSDEESIDKEDLVAWYTLGVSHAPRAEEWPVMPAARVGFKLLPDGFFARNPTAP